MNLFSISELQQYSGIKAHTIRIWEQRYNALKPERSEGNTRYYDGAQLRRLLNIVSLKNDNFKVSELCTMSDEQLNNLLDEHLSKVSSSDADTEYLVSQCIAAAMEFDGVKFDKFFSVAVQRFGLKETYTQVLYPMLVRLGIMWMKDAFPTAQEHFISNKIRQKLSAAIEAIPLSSQQAQQTWVLFLLENEMHEIGLLLAYYLIQNAGHKVVYLGSNLPFSSLELAVKELNPSNLLFFLVRKNDAENDLAMIEQMKTTFPEQSIFMAADSNRLVMLKNSKKFKRLNTVEELENSIRTIVLN
ncbi:MAG: MerR family transcriptional regulator [Bacteroidota bacterium]